MQSNQSISLIAGGTGARLLAWSLFGTAVLLIIVALAFRLWNFQELSEEISGPEWWAEIIWWNVLIPLAAPAFAKAGQSVAPRHPGNPVGWLFLLLGNLIAFQDIVWQYTMRTYILSPGSLPFESVAGILANVTAPVVVILAFALILLLFPTGAVSAPRWRYLYWALLAALGLNLLGGLLTSDIGMTGETPAPNPLALSVVSGIAGTVYNLTQLASPLLLLLAIASVFTRWRASEGVQRQQLKWLAFVAAVSGVSLIIALPVALLTGYSYLTIVPISVAIGGITVGIPAAMGVSILRYRLFDIDLVINRALVYVSLTLLLASGYAVSVLVLQRLFGRFLGGEDIAIVVATLLAVAAVRPGRNRIQQAVDRHFFRQKYDASRTLARLGRSIQDEVELDRLQRAMANVIDETMRPRTISIWLSEPAVTAEPGRARDAGA